MLKVEEGLEDLWADWRRLLRNYRVAESDALEGFDTLTKGYSEDGRFYHNLNHVRDVLAKVEDLRQLTRDIGAVRLAVWFHDVIYDTRASDNEEQSASVAWGWGALRYIRHSTLDEVARLILLTRTHQTTPNDADGQVLLDADLSILGAGEREYAEYARAIRQEYGWVPEEDYRKGRSAVLQRFLQRERIFQTGPMVREYELRARRNLEREVEALTW